MDTLLQRVKAQEAIAHGSAWSVAQQMEIPSSEATTLAARSEMDIARKLSYDESRSNWLSQRPTGGGQKGDSKGKGKSKSEKGSSGKSDKKGDKKEQEKGSERK